MGDHFGGKVVVIWGFSLFFLARGAICRRNLFFWNLWVHREQSGFCIEMKLFQFLLGSVIKSLFVYANKLYIVRFNLIS